MNPEPCLRTEVARIDLAAVTTAPGLARAFVRHILRAWELSGLCDDAELITSELVTNATRATPISPTDGTINGRRSTCLDLRTVPLVGLELGVVEGALRIAVRDGGHGHPAVRRPEYDAERGRGLLLVDALGARWDVQPVLGGKVTWAELSMTPASAMPRVAEADLRKRRRPRRLHHEPQAITWAREKAGLTKRSLAERVGISEQLVGEIESGWRSATPTNLARIAEALNCPIVVLERKRHVAGQPTR